MFKRKQGKSNFDLPFDIDDYSKCKQDNDLASADSDEFSDDSDEYSDTDNSELGREYNEIFDKDLLLINMFYEQTDINEELKCKKCNKQFDVPKNLPCGDVICEKCCNEYILISDSQFKCPICNETHDAPKNLTFPTNKNLLNILNRIPKELFRGKHVELLKSKVYGLKNKTKEIEQCMSNGAEKIIEHCNNLKNEVHSATELLHEQINMKNRQLIEKIEIFQNESIKNYENKQRNTNLEAKFQNKLFKIKKFSLECIKYLNETKIEEATIGNFIDKSNNFRKLQNKMNSYLNNILFDSKMITFEKKSPQSDENTIGSILVVPIKNTDNDLNDTDDAILNDSSYICSICGQKSEKSSKCTPPKQTGACQSIQSTTRTTTAIEISKESVEYKKVEKVIEERLVRESAKKGTVQISLMWFNRNDLDLHVVDPSGEEIYYGHRVSKSRGELDVDMNAGGCSSDSPVENIVWPNENAPCGEYKVYVKFYSQKCSIVESDYKISIKFGNEYKIFTGKIKVVGEKLFVCSFYNNNGEEYNTIIMAKDEDDGDMGLRYMVKEVYGL